jgi:hypothetical protein
LSLPHEEPPAKTAPAKTVPLTGVDAWVARGQAMTAAVEAALAYLMPAWGYTRIANPTTGYLEETLALLETYGTDAEASCVVTSSGMAAVHLATNAPLAADPDLPRPNLVASARCYGGTFMLFQRYLAERGIAVRWISDRWTPMPGRRPWTRAPASCMSRCRQTRRCPEPGAVRGRHPGPRERGARRRRAALRGLDGSDARAAAADGARGGSDGQSIR